MARHLTGVLRLLVVSYGTDHFTQLAVQSPTQCRKDKSDYLRALLDSKKCTNSDLTDDKRAWWKIHQEALPRYQLNLHEETFEQHITSKSQKRQT